jgi:hypothetical protein
MNKEKSKKMVDVTGGYDEAIEQYGESKGETNHF